GQNLIGGGAQNNTVPLFQGRMGWMSLYNSPLTAVEVNEEMTAGFANRNKTFQKQFPVDFDLYSEYNGDQVPALFLLDASLGQNMFLQISNESSQQLSIPSVKTDVPAQFQLHFRNSVLSDIFTSQTTLKLVDTNWSATIAENGQSGDYVISFWRTGAAKTLSSGESFTIVIPGVSGNTAGGARNTNVEMTYEGISLLPSSGSGSGTAILGSRLQNLSIVSHLGNKDIPLHVGVVGAGSILNDGVTKNQLSIRVQNAGDTINFSDSATLGKTVFTIKLPTGSNDWDLLDSTGNQPAVSMTEHTLGSVKSFDITSVSVSLSSAPPTTAVGTSIEVGPIGDTASYFTTISQTYSSCGANTLEFACTEDLTMSAIQGQITAANGASWSPKVIFYNNNNSMDDQSIEFSLCQGTCKVTLSAPLGIALSAGQEVLISGTSYKLIADATADQDFLLFLGGYDSDGNPSVPTISAGQSVSLQPVAGSADGGVFSFSPEFMTLEKGDALVFNITELVTDRPTGIGYIEFGYSNIQNFWDGSRFLPVEKTPIIVGEDQVGLGTTPLAGARLSLGFDDSGVANAPVNGLMIGDLAQLDTSKLKNAALNLIVQDGGTVDPLLVQDSQGAKYFTLDSGGNLTLNGKITSPTGDITDLNVSDNLTVKGTLDVQTAPSGAEMMTSLYVSSWQVGLCGKNTSSVANATVMGNFAVINGQNADLVPKIGFGVGGTTNFVTYLAADDSNELTINAPNGIVIQGINNSNGDNPTQTKTMSTIFTPNNYVGIGMNDDPNYPLEVQSCGTSPSIIGQYFNDKVALGTFSDPASLSIVASYGIAASDFIATGAFNTSSDIRIKEQIKTSLPRLDLDTLLKLRIADYAYVDQVAHGVETTKGLIAQEVEQVLPQAVKRTTDFIPDVYAAANSIQVNEADQQLEVALATAHGFTVGDQVRLITDDETFNKKVCAVKDDQTFVVENWKFPKVTRVFVYGKKVNDFRTVDYNQVAMLGVSAIQALHAEVDDLKKENQSLKRTMEEELSAMRAEMAALKSMMKVGN
ncbi:MAG: tail fiber domain-containing protein, partial [Bacteroidota bacterium]